MTKTQKELIDSAQSIDANEGSGQNLYLQGRSRISGKGAHMYKGVCGGGGGGGVFALLILSHFSSISHLTETKLFHFHRIFKNGGQRGGFKRTPSGSATDLALLDMSAWACIIGICVYLIISETLFADPIIISLEDNFEPAHEIWVFITYAISKAKMNVQSPILPETSPLAQVK